MRRARFAVSDGERNNERASVKDTLTFDLRTPETADDESLVAQSAEEGGREIEHRRPLPPHTGRRAGSSLTVVWRLFPVPDFAVSCSTHAPGRRLAV